MIDPDLEECARQNDVRPNTGTRSTRGLKSSKGTPRLKSRWRTSLQAYQGQKAKIVTLAKSTLEIK